MMLPAPEMEYAWGLEGGGLESGLIGGEWVLWVLAAAAEARERRGPTDGRGTSSSGHLCIVFFFLSLSFIHTPCPYYFGRRQLEIAHFILALAAAASHARDVGSPAKCAPPALPNRAAARNSSQP